MIYVFTRAHTLERVPYAAGDEIERTTRLGDWLIAQGVPMRRKVAEVVPSDVVPAMVERAHSMPREVRPTGLLQRINNAATPRWSCCGGFRKK